MKWEEKYTKINEIGGGGFGIVYEVIDDFGNEYALKEMLPTLKDEVKRRFRREVKVQRDILPHVNIIEVLDLGDDPDYPEWYTMPKAGCNLFEKCREMPQDDQDILVVFNQVLDAIEYAHKNGIFHRDLKPENILISASGNVKVADFGLAKDMSSFSKLTKTTDEIGTLPYVAPELFRNAKDASVESDIYALGGVLYFLVTGREPSILNFRTTHKLSPVINKSTSLARESRYKSIEALRRELKVFISPEAVGTPIEVLKSLNITEDITREDIIKFHKALIESKYWDGIMDFIFTLPDKILNTYFSDTVLLNDLFEILESTLDDVLHSRISFDYLDRIADFYRSLFNRVSDYSIQCKALQRIFNMGVDFNRFYVMQVFGRMATLDNVSIQAMARDILLQSPKDASMVKYYFPNGSLPPIIAATFREIEESNRLEQNL